MLPNFIHELWSSWMVYLFSKTTMNDDGSATIPKWAVDRWKRQMTTDYCDLPPNEQASDIEEAKKLLELLDIQKIRNTLSLLYSMTTGKEDHSQYSITQYNETLDLIVKIKKELQVKT